MMKRQLDLTYTEKEMLRFVNWLYSRNYIKLENKDLPFERQIASWLAEYEKEEYQFKLTEKRNEEIKMRIIYENLVEKENKELY